MMDTGNMAKVEQWLVRMKESIDHGHDGAAEMAAYYAAQELGAVFHHKRVELGKHRSME